MAAAIAGVILILLAIALSFGIVAATTAWGVIPVVLAFGGPELPFWPTFVVVWAGWCIFSYRPLTQLNKKENA